MVAPISPARYKVAFTASAELHDKLERLRELMRSSVTDGDLGSIIEQAVTEKLERLESKRFAKTKAPPKEPRRDRHIPFVTLHPGRGQASCLGSRPRPMYI